MCRSPPLRGMGWVSSEEQTHSLLEQKHICLWHKKREGWARTRQSKTITTQPDTGKKNHSTWHFTPTHLQKPMHTDKSPGNSQSQTQYLSHIHICRKGVNSTSLSPASSLSTLGRTPGRKLHCYWSEAYPLAKGLYLSHISFAIVAHCTPTPFSTSYDRDLFLKTSTLWHIPHQQRWSICKWETAKALWSSVPTGYIYIHI